MQLLSERIYCFRKHSQEMYLSAYSVKMRAEVLPSKNRPLISSISSFVILDLPMVSARTIDGVIIYTT